MHLFWGFFQICLDGLLRPLHFLIHVNPSPIFARDPHVVTDGMILFFALRKLTSGLRGHTGFIYLTIYYWDDIRWEGEMLHDLSEVDLGLAISDVTDWKDYRVMPMHGFNSFKGGGGDITHMISRIIREGKVYKRTPRNGDVG